MTTRVRSVLLACTALLGLAFASSALAAFTPALAIGHPDAAVAQARRPFVRDPETNPGRANLFALNGIVVDVNDTS